MAGIIGNKPASQHAEFLAYVTDSESAETLRKIVGDLAILDAVINIGTPQEAIAHLESMKRPPKQLLVDISQSEMPLTDVNLLADACEPGIHVVVVGTRNDIGLFRELMRLGVADYVTKPLTPTLMQRTLVVPGGNYEPVRQTRSGNLVTVVGARGGVGASTVASSLAYRLSHQFSRRTVLVDFDLKAGGVNMMLNQRTNLGLSDALLNAVQLDTAFMESIFVEHSPRMYLLTTEVPLEDEVQVTDQGLQKLTNQLQHQFHYMICDVPLSSGWMLRYMLEHSDVNIMVTDTSAIAARNLLRMLKLTNPLGSTQRTTVVRNNVRPESDSMVSVAEFEKTIERGIDHIIPYAGKALSTAEDLGEIYAAESGPLTQAIQAVAQDLMGAGAVRKGGAAADKSSSLTSLIGGLNRVWTKAAK